MEIKQIAEYKPRQLKQKRATAYARVSVNSEDTERSLAQQISYYDQLIQKSPEYTLFKIYADDGLSGTREDRPEFMQMMEDARAHLYDVLFTKSVTRLARNTVTLIRTVRELKELNIDVFFEKENIHSLSQDGELILTLLAMFAEEEARSVSENVKWSYEKRFLKGEGVLKAMYGYTVFNKQYVIVPEEAEIVRKIYDAYLNGATIYGITRDLNNKGFLRAEGKPWNTTAIYTILKNEKYTGSMLLQKTYRPDFKAKRSVKNNGQKRQYLVVDTHEAIIPPETYEKVQQELEKRKENRPERSYTISPDNLFYKKVKCSECGFYYKRYALTNPKYKKKPWYTCQSAKDFREKCKSHIIKEETLVDKTKEVLMIDKDTKLTREMIDDKIAQIVCTPDFKLEFYLKDGRTKTLNWKDYFYGTPSRREDCRKHCEKMWQEGKLKTKTMNQKDKEGA